MAPRSESIERFKARLEIMLMDQKVRYSNCIFEKHDIKPQSEFIVDGWVECLEWLMGPGGIQHLEKNINDFATPEMLILGEESPPERK